MKNKNEESKSQTVTTGNLDQLFFKDTVTVISFFLSEMIFLLYRCSLLVSGSTEQTLEQLRTQVTA